MKKQAESKPTVVLYPPILSLNPRSDKYKLIFDIKWGDFKNTVIVSREEAGFMHKMVDGINQAFLEGSESNPYLLK